MSPRLYLPLRPIAIGCTELDLWEAIPPLDQSSIWLYELHAEGYEPGASVSDLSIFPSDAQRREGHLVRLITVRMPAQLLDPTRGDFQSLPRPPRECKVGERICARSSGRIRRLIVVCTTRDGVACPKSSAS